jgi:membrane protein DedA with SNARE-associated domain
MLWPHLAALLAPAASITGTLASFATRVVADLGLVGIFVLMLLDCACIPIPSEVTMLFAGFGVSRGDFSLPAVVAAGTLGNVVGSQLAYAVGFYGRAKLLERHTQLPVVGDRALDRAQRWFDRYGPVSVLLSRILPLVRSYISLPAGLGRMPFGRFSMYTLLGCFPWVLALATVGTVVGRNWTQWRDQLLYVDYAVLAGTSAAVSVLIVHWLRRRNRDRD